MPAKVTLTILGGALDGTIFAFDEPIRCVTIGRGENCSVRLPNRGWDFKMVSRHHCKLDIDPPHVCVRDLGSRNGTYVNGLLIGFRDPEEPPESAGTMASSGYELHDEDILAIGPVHFRVTVKGAEKAKAEPAHVVGESEAPGAEENVGESAEEMMFAI
jgi:pSer/pThr/pTyr-binding forkhead associated (FHA) protein